MTMLSKFPLSFNPVRIQIYPENKCPSQIGKRIGITHGFNRGRKVFKIMTQSFDCLEEAHTWKLPSQEEEKKMWVKYYEIKCRVCGATKMQKHPRQTKKEAKAKIEQIKESISFDRSRRSSRSSLLFEDRSEIPNIFGCANIDL